MNEFWEGFDDFYAEFGAINLRGLGMAVVVITFVLGFVGIWFLIDYLTGWALFRFLTGSGL